jgi:predicted nucleic acid-binding Zn finger protein
MIKTVRNKTALGVCYDRTEDVHITIFIDVGNEASLVLENGICKWPQQAGLLSSTVCGKTIHRVWD